jgi:hypothetical protein
MGFMKPKADFPEIRVRAGLFVDHPLNQISRFFKLFGVDGFYRFLNNLIDNGLNAHQPFRKKLIDLSYESVITVRTQPDNRIIQAGFRAAGT